MTRKKRAKQKAQPESYYTDRGIVQVKVRLPEVVAHRIKVRARQLGVSVAALVASLAEES